MIEWKIIVDDKEYTFQDLDKVKELLSNFNITTVKEVDFGNKRNYTNDKYVCDTKDEKKIVVEIRGSPIESRIVATYAMYFEFWLFNNNIDIIREKKRGR